MRSVLLPGGAYTPLEFFQGRGKQIASQVDAPAVVQGLLLQPVPDVLPVDPSFVVPTVHDANDTLNQVVCDVGCGTRGVVHGHGVSLRPFDSSGNGRVQT